MAPGPMAEVRLSLLPEDILAAEVGAATWRTRRGLTASEVGATSTKADVGFAAEADVEWVSSACAAWGSGKGEFYVRFGEGSSLAR